MPSWAYLVVIVFAGMLAWPAVEGRVLRTLRRLRRRLSRGRTYRTPYSASVAVRGATPSDPTDPRVTPIKSPRRAA